jgi:hypothetical protein
MKTTSTLEKHGNACLAVTYKHPQNGVVDVTGRHLQTCIDQGCATISLQDPSRTDREQFTVT